MAQRYREMADDPLRLAAFRDAIRAEVRAGEIAADVGCGLGTYAVFACRAGAERVYAIDDGPIIEVAREIVRKNGCADRVRLLAGRSTELEPVERVDVAIFEDYIAGLLSPGIVTVLRDLRARWLKPGGRFLPARARVWAACVEARELHQSLDRFAGTQERVLGVDLGPARRRAFAAQQNVTLRPAALLAAPGILQELDVAAIDELRIKGSSAGPARRDGLAHGVLVWFDLFLPPTGWLGTGPLDAPSPWRQVFLPFETPLPIVEGERIAIDLDAAALGESIVWRWRAEASAGTAAAHSLDALALSHEVLNLGRPDRVPSRTPELELDAAILAAVDGTRDLATIAERLRAAQPGRFANGDDATARVARVLARYGETPRR